MGREKVGKLESEAATDQKGISVPIISRIMDREMI